MTAAALLIALGAVAMSIYTACMVRRGSRAVLRSTIATLEISYETARTSVTTWTRLIDTERTLLQLSRGNEQRLAHLQSELALAQSRQAELASTLRRYGRTES